MTCEFCMGLSCMCVCVSPYVQARPPSAGTTPSLPPAAGAKPAAQKGKGHMHNNPHALILGSTQEPVLFAAWPGVALNHVLVTSPYVRRCQGACSGHSGVNSGPTLPVSHRPGHAVPPRWYPRVPRCHRTGGGCAARCACWAQHRTADVGAGQRALGQDLGEIASTARG